MTAVIGATDRALCHCDAGPGGHEPGVDECRSALRTSRYHLDPLPGVGAHGKPADAVGTCPVCGRAGVKVVRVETRGLPGPALHRREGETALEFIYRYEQLQKTPRGPLLEVAIAVVAHRTPGGGGTPCDGAGQVPAETRCTPGRGRLLTDWIEAYGPDSVMTR